MDKYYWHFIGPDKKLGYRDGRKIRRGATLKVDPNKLKLCKYGLHASERVIDALDYCYWKNPILCKVELSGKVIKSDNKYVASERKVVDYTDATSVLQRFAVRVARDVLPIFEDIYPNDLMARNCIETTESYLNGEVSKEDAIAARNAAYTASAVYTAATAASAAAYAGDAALAATYAAVAAYAAAYAAARAAAYANVLTPARKEKWEQYNKWLTEMVEAEMGGTK